MSIAAAADGQQAAYRCSGDAGLRVVRSDDGNAPGAPLGGRGARARRLRAVGRPRDRAHFVRDNSLSIFFLAIFLASLAGQAIAGHGAFNHDQLLHHGDPISLGRYLSKALDKAGLESDEDQQVGSHAGPRSPRWARTGGLRTALYGNSLLIVMTTIWLGSWLAQSIAGPAATTPPSSTIRLRL